MSPDETKKPVPKDYDERIYRKGNPPHRVRIALIAIVLVIVGTYFGWTKELPFQHPLRAEGGVRERGQHPQGLAGADRRRQRGQGTGVERRRRQRRGHLHREGRRPPGPRGRRGRDPARGSSSRATSSSTCTPAARAPRSSATGDEIPITHTSTAVQLDEVLTALQTPDRANLVQLLQGFGTGLNRVPPRRGPHPGSRRSGPDRGGGDERDLQVRRSRRSR